MSGTAPRRQSNMVQNHNLSNVKKSFPCEKDAAATNGFVNRERMVKKLRLSKALTLPEGTTVLDACKRMTAKHVDAVLLTDSNALLSGIVTDKDITSRVIAEELKPEQTIISKMMTRNPIFVNSDSLAIEALEKMVQGKFRHLPVVENGEVIAMLDITKCLYDAILKLEKAAEQGSALAAAVEGVERQFGSNFSASPAFIESLREHMFKPSLSSIISENSRVVAIGSPSDSVQVAAKRMRDLRVNSVLIMTGNKIQGIVTSKDIFTRVVAQNLSPELTLVEKVMTTDPECAMLETTILEALHIMHGGKFLHLPVVDKDGCVAACIDVLQITHAAISMVESSSAAVNDVANTVMQKFWDSALNLEPPDDYDTHSEISISQYMASDPTELVKSKYPSLGLRNSFSFKVEDHKGHMHRFNYGMDNLDDLISAIMQRVGTSNSQVHPQLLYEDDDGDKVLLSTNEDLIAAVSRARSVGLKVLRLHLDCKNLRKLSSDTIPAEKADWITLQSGIVAGAVILTSIGVLVYLKRSNT